MADSPSNARPELSIVTTMYQSSPYLAEFYERTKSVAEPLFSSIEFVFVNDGSPDDSLAVALALAQIDDRIRIVDLSRNFGHHYAILAGLEHSRGTFVFLVDCDLEERPEDLLPLYERLRTDAADVAYGVQIVRKGGMIERFGGLLFYRILDILSGNLHLPRNMLVTRVMTRRYVDAFIRQRENQVVFSYLAAATGFKQVAIPTVKTSKGTSSYNFTGRVRMMVHSTIAFSDRPLRLIAYAGFIITASAFLYTLFLLAMYAFYQTVPPGYTSLAVSVWLLGGATIFSVGIVAIYLSVMYAEVKHRPRYIVRETFGFDRVTPEQDRVTLPDDRSHP